MGFGMVLGKALCLPLKVAGAIRRFLSSQMKYQSLACVQLTHFFSFRDWMDWASCTAYWKSESLLSDFLKMHPFSSSEIQFIVSQIFKWSVGIRLTSIILRVYLVAGTKLYKMYSIQLLSISLTLTITNKSCGSMVSRQSCLAEKVIQK